MKNSSWKHLGCEAVRLVSERRLRGADIHVHLAVHDCATVWTKHFSRQIVRPNSGR
jgi:hypothetical protein